MPLGSPLNSVANTNLRFSQAETGALSIDWVVLTLALTGLGLTASLFITPAAQEAEPPAEIAPVNRIVSTSSDG